MKKYIYIAAAFAALLSCSKSEQPNNEISGTGFQKGQQVTLHVTAGEPSTRVSSALNTEDGTTVDFKWEKEDVIKVTVGTESVPFTLIGEGGSASGYFTGTMPASGDEFDVQYPYDGVAESALASQSYTEGEALPKNLMLFSKSGCTGTSFELDPQFAALRLNLWGTKQTISKIVVTNTTSTAATKPTYTLNINGGKTLSSDSSNPTPFFVVVPAGNYNFRAEVIDAGTVSGTPPADAIQNGVFTVGATNVFSTSSAKTFTAGWILNMDAKQVHFTKVYFSKGNLYYDGSFKFENTQYAYTASYDPNHVCRFRWANNSGTISDDISSAISTETSLSGTTNDVFFTNATQTTPRSDFTVVGQKGVWRTLSEDEWDYLLGRRIVNGATGDMSAHYAIINSDGTGVGGMIIYPDNYTSQTLAASYTSSQWTTMQDAGCVFIPNAGHRDGTYLVYVGSVGYLWSSTPSSDIKAYRPIFSYNGIYTEFDCHRIYGLSVRLVSAAQ